MIINILTFYTYLFFCSISIFGYGLLFVKIILNSKENNPGLIGVLGFFLLFAISILLHFFFKLDQNLNLLILIFGFLIGLRGLKYFEIILEYKYFFILFLVIFLLSIFSASTYADYEWYHLPYVNYVTNYKIIFGLVNISNNYAYGHGWLDIISLFKLPFIKTKGLTALPIIFYSYFILFFLHELYNSKNFYIKIFSLFTIVISFIIFNRLKDFGADIQPTFVIFILIFYILKFTLNEDNENALKYVILFFFYSCVLRIGSVVSLPLVLIFFIFNIKKYFLDIIFTNMRIYTFLLFFFIIFILKNFITTGCIFYPIPFTCFDNKKIIWANPIENVEERFEFLSAIAKRWKFYSIHEGNLNNRYDYYDKIENQKIMSPKEYNAKKFFWIKYFFYDHDFKRLINLFIFSFIFSIALFFTLKKDRFVKSYKKPKYFKYLIFSLIMCICFWFFSSPQMRYGGYPLFSGLIVTIIIFLLNYKNILENKFDFFKRFFLIIAIFYFGYKNINTSVSDFLNHNFTNFPWPNISQKKENIDFYSEIYNGIQVNFISKNDGIDSGSPKTCGDVSMPCLASGRKVCVSELYTKLNYIFVPNTNKKCLEQFKKNYWQH